MNRKEAALSAYALHLFIKFSVLFFTGALAYAVFAGTW
jgi:hypothetical protein